VNIVGQVQDASQIIEVTINACPIAIAADGTHKIRCVGHDGGYFMLVRR